MALLHRQPDARLPRPDAGQLGRGLLAADRRRGRAECTTPPGELRTVAAFGPWDTLGAVPTFTTVGNNANTHEAWASPLTPGGLLQAPISPERHYTGEFTDAWNNSRCDAAQLVPGGNDIDASVGNLFVAHNRMHDYSYYLGFTEENYNLQSDNGSRGGAAGDPEVGNAQAGAISGGSPSFLGRDNANQIALQDGIPGITNQYLFEPIAGAFYAPCTDGGLDMGIVGHEYTHAISNRMIGGPDEGITSEQGGAMGESWGDLVAGEYQFAHGYSNGGNVWAVGAYATGNTETAIRDYSIDHNPLNYSDYGFDTTGPEVHADGEIWNGTMWEVRQALVEKYADRFPYDDAALQRACADATATSPRGRRPPAPATAAGSSSSSTRSCSSRAPRRCSTPATRCSPRTGCASAVRTRTSCGPPSPAAAWVSTRTPRTRTTTSRRRASRPRRARTRRSPSRPPARRGSTSATTRPA